MKSTTEDSMGAVVDHETGELLTGDERSDDEWEHYIREASVENAIVERGKRWLQFFEHCHTDHGKQGGSHFKQFALDRFGIKPNIASMWVTIGKGEEELFDVIEKFTADWRAMYDFLKLSPPQKKILLSSDQLINQKAIKVLKGGGGSKSNGGVSGPIQKQEAPQPEKAKSRGVALKYAHQAIAALGNIPPNDGLRDEALDEVIRWIEDNR